MKEKLLPTLVYWVFKLLQSTWRKKEAQLPESIKKRIADGQKVVFCHYHEEEWAMLAFYHKRPMHVMVSNSKDGNMMTAFLKKFSYDVSRGSSSRGGARALIHILKNFSKSSCPSLSFAVDGPRGPRREVKKGAAFVAKKLNCPIVVGRIKSSNSYVFKKSWAKTILPLPFSRVELGYSGLIDCETIQSQSVEEITLLISKAFKAA